MPLDTAALKTGIKQLHDDMITRDVDSNDEYAQRLSDLIEAFVKSGDGHYQTGSLQQSGTTGIIAVLPTVVKIQ